MQRVLLCALIAFALLLPLNTVARAQPDPQLSQSREATLSYLSTELAKVQSQIRSTTMMNASAIDLKPMLDGWLKQLAAISDALKNNPYVRLVNFSINIPSGVSVTLEFK